MKKMQISTCVYSLLMVGYVSNIDGALEKRLTHMPFTHAFTGSNPVPVTIYGGLAQLGEHLPYKQRVSGSSPLTSTI